MTTFLVLIPLIRLAAPLRIKLRGTPFAKASGGLPPEALAKGGGAEENRTPDLDIANVALYQLSYRPIKEN